MAANPLSINPEDSDAVCLVYPLFPTDELTIPPFLNSAALVNILIVPPTAGMASLEAPRPLCTCILLVTSANPAQLDQYTQPDSISLTGTPFTITAILFCSNPLTLILESPKPPPSLVT